MTATGNYSEEAKKASDDPSQSVVSTGELELVSAGLASITTWRQKGR